MTRVVLHVDRLVLNGFTPRDRDAFVEALRHGLERRLRDPEVARQLAAQTDRARLDVSTLSAPVPAPAARIGRQVAHGIARGLTS